MSKQDIIERTIKVIQKLPEDKAAEVSDFADFIFKRYEEQLLSSSIQNLVAESQSFLFLNDEDELYNTEDLKEVYHEKR